MAIRLPRDFQEAQGLLGSPSSCGWGRIFPESDMQFDVQKDQQICPHFLKAKWKVEINVGPQAMAEVARELWSTAGNAFWSQ